VRVRVRRICFDSLHHSQPGGAGSLVRAEFGMYGLYLSLQEGLYGSTSDSLALKVSVSESALQAERRWWRPMQGRTGRI